MNEGTFRRVASGIIAVMVSGILSLATIAGELPEQLTTCKYGVYIKTLKVNQTDENFDVVFYWWLRVDSIDVALDYTGVGDIELVNADAEIDTVDARVDTAGRYYYMYGSARATIPYQSVLQNFPFDTQFLRISLENKTYGRDLVRYVPDDKSRPFNIDYDTTIDILNGGQYYIDKIFMETAKYVYKTTFGDPTIEGDDTYARLNVVISVRRNAAGIFEKIALPLLVVLILSYLVFYIAPEDIGTSSALAVTALLAAIAFQWTLSDTLPKVTYPTMVDKIFYLVYFYIFYSMAQSVWTYNLARGGDEDQLKTHRSQVFSRIFFPVSFIAVLAYIIIG
jgi:hypothetical protein